MLTLLYRLILLLIIAIIIRTVLEEEGVGQQLTGAIVLVPLILRFLMVK